MVMVLGKDLSMRCQLRAKITPDVPFLRRNFGQNQEYWHRMQQQVHLLSMHIPAMPSAQNRIFEVRQESNVYKAVGLCHKHLPWQSQVNQQPFQDLYYNENRNDQWTQDFALDRRDRADCWHVNIEERSARGAQLKCRSDSRSGLARPCSASDQRNNLPMSVGACLTKHWVFNGNPHLHGDVAVRNVFNHLLKILLFCSILFRISCWHV